MSQSQTDAYIDAYKKPAEESYQLYINRIHDGERTPTIALLFVKRLAQNLGLDIAIDVRNGGSITISKP